MTSEKQYRKERKENQNIQVFVRLRPLNQREKDIKSLGVVEVVNGREIFVRQSHQTLHTKKFTFDRAFPPHSKQVEVYQEVVSPLIEEVLAGYNCTVFAYGQTGTGKTHTMVGEAATDEMAWQNDPLAGIIPRALSQLFDELRISNTEYTVRVSYLELYNEELFDLLSGSDDNSKLRIYEDVTRKGSNIVNGLEEITVYNKNEVYRIMAQGQERKKVASTLMNAQSSRSHTVFTIVVHMKENSPEGEELVKIGKLNLVDLAGSENISKAGSDNPAKKERARECVNINQSLLTLGRVITALVERHPHIPYRESKLTRILQESLGGRTKTSIIATISPGHKDVEETLSTLEYANRAKNIQNKPEINQKMTKRAILKEYAEEIDKLKRDLQAARDKNGIYLANETYAEITFKQEEQKKEIQELLLKKRAMEEERDRMQEVFGQLQGRLEGTEGRLTATLDRLSTTERALTTTTTKLARTEQDCDEQRYLVDYQKEKERALSQEAQQVLHAADAAATDASKLLDVVDKRKQVESRNLEMTRTYREVSARVRSDLQAAADTFVSHTTQHVADVHAELESYTSDSTKALSDTKQKSDTLIQNTMQNIEMVTKAKNDMYASVDDTLNAQRSALTQLVRGAHDETGRALGDFGRRVSQCVERAAAADLSELARLLDTWVTAARTQLQTTSDTHAALHAVAAGAAQRQSQTARRSRDTAAHRTDERARNLRRVLQAIADDEVQNNKMLQENSAKLEKERENRENTLLQWMEKKRRLLQEEIEEFIQRRKTSVEQEIEERMKTEREYLEELIKCNKNSIEEQQKSFEASKTRNIEWLKEIIAEDEKEMETVDQQLQEKLGEAESCMKELDGLTDKYKQESAVVSSSVESLPAQVVGVAEQIKHRMVADLEDSQRSIQEQTEQIVSASARAASTHEAGVESALEAAGAGCRRAVELLLGEMERCSSTVAQGLSEVSSWAALGEERARLHSAAHLTSLGGVQGGMEEFYRVVREQLRSQEELEERCLRDEYAVYTPSGTTPARARYSYPRKLTVASPHQRVLQRYRSTRVPSFDDDCVVVEDDSRSESESSASEEMVSPPAIIKCTSETDLYLRRKQQELGKENTQVNRSMSFKKPSKLPAPSVAKRPLVERNADQ